MSDEAKQVDETVVANLCRLWLDDDGDEHTEALRGAFAAMVPSTPDALIQVAARTEAHTWKRVVELYNMHPFGKRLFDRIRLVCTGEWTAKVARRCFREMRQLETLRGLRMRGALLQQLLL